METNPPRLPWEQGAAIVLRPLMLTRAGGKLTHWFDWENLPEGVDLSEGVELPADPAATTINSRNWLTERATMVRMSLGGWKNGFMIGPDPQDKERYEEGWRYAFVGTGKDERRQFSKIVNHGPIVVLAGPTPVFVSGIERSSFNQIPLRVAGPYPARGRLPIQ